mgnify:CR=1 FL=1
MHCHRCVTPESGLHTCVHFVSLLKPALNSFSLCVCLFCVCVFFFNVCVCVQMCVGAGTGASSPISVQHVWGVVGSVDQWSLWSDVFPVAEAHMDEGARGRYRGLAVLGWGLATLLTYTHAHTHIYMYICTCRYTYIHTHTHWFVHGRE